MTASQETSDLLAPMIKKTLWAVLSTAKVSSAEVESHAAQHLHYMNGLEAKGHFGARETTGSRIRQT
jgi:hypothetical protein